MSALTPHIRVLRAEGSQLGARADEYEQLAPTVERTTLIIIFRALAKAKLDAADALEGEEAALKPPREGVDKPITYNPRGKTNT